MALAPLPPLNIPMLDATGAPSQPWRAYFKSLDPIVRKRNFIGSFTRDLSLASGNQSITGVGFQPSALVLIMGIVGGSQFASIGFAGSSGNNSCLEFFDTTPTTFLQPNLAGIVRADAGDFQSCVVASFDADGFTLTWTKTLLPTGTLTCVFLALP